MTERDRPQLALADTNVFVALLAGPVHPLHEAALALFRRVADGKLRLVVTPIVVAELVYACESVLHWSRPAIAERLSSLLRAEGLSVREPAPLQAAFELFGTRRKLDFADAYLAGTALTEGPAGVASFDRDYDAIEGLTRVAA